MSGVSKEGSTDEGEGKRVEEGEKDDKKTRRKKGRGRGKGVAILWEKMRLG